MFNFINKFIISLLETKLFESQYLESPQAFRKELRDQILALLCVASLCVVYIMPGSVNYLISEDVLSFIKIIVAIFSLSLVMKLCHIPLRQLPFAVLLPPFVLIFCVPFVLICFLHLLVPGREFRMQEALAFHLNKEGIAEPKVRLAQIMAAKGTSCFEYFFTLAKADIGEFLKSQGIVEQSLIRFIKERYKDGALNVNPFFIFMILTIPKNKISVDGIKYILLAAAQHTMTENKFLEKIGNIDLNSSFDFAFGGKDELEIKSILTRNYKLDDYVTLLKTAPYTQLNQQGKTIAEVLDNDKKHLNHPSLDRLHDGRWVFKPLRTKSDYRQAKKDFKNCVLHYFDRKSVDILCVYADSKPLACISLESGKITEQKAPYNKSLSAEVKTKIKEKLKNIIT